MFGMLMFSVPDNLCSLVKASKFRNGEFNDVFYVVEQNIISGRWQQTYCRNPLTWSRGNRKCNSAHLFPGFRTQSCSALCSQILCVQPPGRLECRKEDVIPHLSLANTAYWVILTKKIFLSPSDRNASLYNVIQFSSTTKDQAPHTYTCTHRYTNG